MRQHNLTIFDEFIPSGASSAGSPIYTSTEYNSRLGSLNQIALQAVIDNVSASTTFDIFVQHSADGRVWLFKNQGGGVLGTGDISFSSANSNLLAPNQVNSAMWSDACDNVNRLGGTLNGPLLSFVRVAMFFTTSASAHVRIHATLRDR